MVGHCKQLGHWTHQLGKWFQRYEDHLQSTWCYVSHLHMGVSHATKEMTTRALRAHQCLCEQN